jgi:hypothetical protein
VTAYLAWRHVEPVRLWVMDPEQTDYDDPGPPGDPHSPIPPLAEWAAILPLACLPLLLVIGLVLAIRDFFK